jgi:hypothetical protein
MVAYADQPSEVADAMAKAHIVDRDIVERVLAELAAAGNDEQLFDATLRGMALEARVRKPEFVEITRRFTRTAKAPAKKSEAIGAIKRHFTSQLRLRKKLASATSPAV